MEALALTVLSVFAFIGLMSARSYLFRFAKSKYTDKGIKLCLPSGISPRIEGVIRRIFSEEIPERLMTDGKLYVTAADEDEDTKKILENLKSQYPVEVLSGPFPYCMIQEGDQQK